MEVVRYWHYGSSSAISGPAKQHQPLSAKVAGSGGAARPNWFFDIILEQSQRQLQAEATHGPCGSGSSSSNNNNNKNNSHYINRCSSKNDESQNSSNGGSKSSVLPDLLLPFPCHCADCMAMFPTALGRTVPAEALSKTASPPRNKPGRPKGSLTKRKTDELPPRSEVETPTKMSVAVLDRATNTFSQKLYDTIYPPQYQAQQLRTSAGGDFRRMLVSDVSGVEWGLFSLRAGAAKPMRYTHACHYVFFVVCGAAFVTMGSSYAARRQRAYVTPGFAFEVPRGNFYAVANAQADAPVTIMFVKAPNLPRPAAAATGPARTASAAAAAEAAATAV